MSMYRDEVNKYKAKRIGQIDAKVVAPKGRKKNVEKPWCVVVQWDSFPSWGPMQNRFAKEHDARNYYRKQKQGSWKTCQLEFNGEVIECSGKNTEAIHDASCTTNSGMASTVMTS